MSKYILENIPEGYSEREIESWTDGTELLFSGLSKDGGCFYVVTRNEDEEPHSGYGLLRFFVINGKTACSVDVNDQELDEFLATILERFVGDMVPAEQIED